MSDCETMNKWMKRIGLFLALALIAATSYAQNNRVVKKVNVLGTAVIHAKNLADGRQNAVNDALVAAVGQVVMEMLTNETVVGRFQLINDSILVDHDKYIKNYRVLSQFVSGTTVRTLVRVDVAADRVSRDLSRLGFALAGTVYPRVLFMVAERNVTDAGFTFWWGDQMRTGRTISGGAMAAALKATGFDVVDPPNLDSPLGLPLNAPEPDLLALAGRLGADVLIVGSGAASAAPNTMGGAISAFEAVVEARAFNVKTGQSMGQTRQQTVVSGQDTVKGGRDALSGGGALAGDALARQVMAAWQQDQDLSGVIEVVVEGTGGHIASFVRLRRTISSLSGVKELKMKEMSADRAAMAVNYQGSTRSLADALLLNTFSGFGIDIFEVTPEAIRIRLVHQ